jgi:hypothetical protein
MLDPYKGYKAADLFQLRYCARTCPSERNTEMPLFTATLLALVLRDAQRDVLKKRSLQ